MINKIYKRIHNKYSTLFKFIFFLRYLFGIFFISVVIFLSIPYFFDFKKNDIIIKNYLFQSYGLDINKYDNIKYHALPRPYIEIQNAEVSIEADSIQMNVAMINIYPKLLNIYNFKNFKANKIVLDKNKISLLVSDLKNLITYIYKLNNKIFFENLDIAINRKNFHLISLKKISYSNYGYSKDTLKGELLDKKFKITADDNFNKINFKLPKVGITADLNLNELKEGSKLSGIFKSKLINSKIKFNFEFDNNKLKIYNSYFRNRDLSFNNESTIVFHPFFSSSSVFNIEDINIKLLKDINFSKILTLKSIIKKINIKDKINFKSKKLNNNLIDDISFDVDLAYGRLIYVKKILISDNFLVCSGDVDLLKEYPVLNFDCSIKLKDKQKFLKKFNIKYKNKNEIFESNIEGSLNILNNKIYLRNITINKDYKASNEDLNYFKQSFESILFDKEFSKIFNFKKIRKFILEIS